MGSTFIIRDGVGVAYMGRPFAPYLSLGIRLSRPIDSGSPLVSPGRRSRCWALVHHLRMVAPCFSRLACGSGGPCLGHVSSNQASSHRAGRIPSVRTHLVVFPSALNRERERVFCPNPLPFSYYCISSLNMGRERVHIPFLRLFLS